MKYCTLLLTTICLAAALQTSACWHKKKKKINTTSQHTQISAGDTVKNLVVSFISTGSGIDYQSLPGFEKSVSDFNARQHCQLMYRKKNWGREGEVDYCFEGSDVTYLSRYYTEVRQKYAANRRIQLKVNGKCKSQ
ncbi:MAG: hypothetical protein RIQ62_1183 [Bacteroidota bacterium]|jgi:hypothetical protein